MGSGVQGLGFDERQTRGTVASTMRRAAHPSRCARYGAGADYSSIKYQSLGFDSQCAGRPLLQLRENGYGVQRVGLRDEAGVEGYRSHVDVRVSQAFEELEPLR